MIIQCLLHLNNKHSIIQIRLVERRSCRRRDIFYRKVMSSWIRRSQCLKKTLTSWGRRRLKGFARRQPSKPSVLLCLTTLLLILTLVLTGCQWIEAEKDVAKLCKRIEAVRDYTIVQELKLLNVFEVFFIPSIAISFSCVIRTSPCGPSPSTFY